MSDIDDGGLVYPIAYPSGGVIHAMGVTRRDDLAKAAMHGIVSDLDAWFSKWVPDKIAKTSYEIADAMIAEGKK